MSEPGRIYLITTCTWGRSPLFRDYRNARRAARVAHDPKTWKGATCLAWVLMPDHWHGLVELHDGDISRVVARFKQSVTRTLREDRKRTYPVWQKGFHERALRKDDDVRQAARYIVANPLRAGLVEHVNLYPYWNAVWL